MPASIDLTRLRDAIGSLQRALEPPPVNDRERDGAIQRFEYTKEEIAEAVFARLGEFSQAVARLLVRLETASRCGG